MLHRIHNSNNEMQVMQPKRGVNWDFKNLCNTICTTIKSNALMELKTINSIKHNNKRVREEKTNTRIFTWFGNPRLRPRL